MPFSNSFPNKSLIIADYSEELLDLTSFIFENNGYDVTAFNSGKKLKNHIINDLSKPPQAFIIETKLEEETGIAVCKQIKNMPSLSKVPVIFFTVASDQDTINKCKDAGADHIVEKPISFTKLEKLVTPTSSGG